MGKDTSYNVLIDCRNLNKLDVVSSLHIAIKFHAKNDTIIMVKVDPKSLWECYAQSLKVTPPTLHN